MTARHVVGIDLGTTHSALAFAAIDDPHSRPQVLQVPQLVGRTELDRRSLLPSFLYFAHASEGALGLPWDSGRRYAVGEFARSRGVEAPARLVSSAKSWLSSASIDRRAAVLPLSAPDDVEKISPVEASFRFLDHLAEAWACERVDSEPDAALAAQELVLAVPASFDAAARELTVEAAYAAGFEQVTLLEEPQAALYAWIEASGDGWRQELRAGDVILVVDVGGGTTDFSAIEVGEEAGELALRRIAVGDHILLGGDNMDLALAHGVAKKLADTGREIDRLELASLTHACRSAKEQLLGKEPPESVALTLASRGSQLMGGTRRSELTRAEVEQTLVDGFFARVDSDAQPARRARSGLAQLGLAYASDPAITRHLAQFLTRQVGAAGGPPGARLLHPSAVLFNGGVMKAPRLRERLLETLNGWLSSDGAASARVLPGADLDLAVARGAAYYGLSRHGRGLTIRGGTARAYYVGIEGSAPAIPGVEPPLSALCVAPFGLQEGSAISLPKLDLAVVVGESVRFRFFGSSVRRDDLAGSELSRWADDELSELSPIELTLPAEGRTTGEIVPVTLAASITAVGTLLLEAVPRLPRKPGERWKIELGVREQG